MAILLHHVLLFAKPFLVSDLTTPTTFTDIYTDQHEKNAESSRKADGPLYSCSVSGKHLQHNNIFLMFFILSWVMGDAAQVMTKRLL
jgi:hypothetical protein